MLILMFSLFVYMKNKGVITMARPNLTIDQLNALSDREYIAFMWGNDILTVIDNQHIVPMTMDDFLEHCTACGGNWGGMLLTGVQKLYPEVYDSIPDDMGHFAWRNICTTLNMLGIISE